MARPFGKKASLTLPKYRLAMSDGAQQAAGEIPREKLILASAGFRGWLFENRCSLALTSLMQSRLFFLGLREDGQIWAHERFLEGAQGLWIDHDQLWLTTAYQIWNFRNILPEKSVYPENRSDRLYCPRLSFVTGNVHAHEVVQDSKNRLVFVNRQYSCLATPDTQHSFTPIWRPHFVSAHTPEDRCHLNGVAMEGGAPKYATALGRSDAPKGWKSVQANGGLVLSVPENEIVAGDLSMPHSPRCHNGRLWILNTGSCEFGFVDPSSGTFTPVCFCPGFARGLTFINDYAVIGVSLPRKNDGFASLPLSGALAKRKASPMCGVLVVDLNRGEVIHWARFEHSVSEISDLSVVPGVRQASMIGFSDRDKVSSMISLDESAVARLA